MITLAVCILIGALFIFTEPVDWIRSDHYHIQMVCSSVQGLKKGDEVRYVGVRVGNVDNITVENGQGVLSLRIKNGARIPKDAEFDIDRDGVIGEYYVRIRGCHDDGNYFTDGMKAEELKSNRASNLMEKAKKLVDTVEKMQGSIRQMEK